LSLHPNRRDYTTSTKIPLSGLLGCTQRIIKPTITKNRGDSITNLLATVTTSEKRKNLLILLLNGPRLWEDIKDLLNVTASGMLPQIKILESEGLVVKEGQQFHLTDAGQIVAFHLEQFDRTLRVIDQQKKYWQEHDIRALPQDFFLRLGELKKTQINEAEMEEILEPHAQSLDMIMKSKKSVRNFPGCPSGIPGALPIACTRRAGSEAYSFEKRLHQNPERIL